jgi:disulfide bond formation protein DsbB
MHHRTDSWLLADWALFGAQVPHWTAVLAGLILVALLVAWFERRKRSPGGDYPSVSRPT